MALSARLLGQVSFGHAGDEVGPLSRKGTALLAYLCLRPEGARREDLAELLWGPGRLANLRQELYALRRLQGAADWLEGGELISVRAHSDVLTLEAVVAGAPATEVLSGELLSGELLPGLERLASPAFLDWLELERRRVAELGARAARAAAEKLQGEGKHREALQVIDASLRVDPLRERLVRAAMRSAYSLGNSRGAIDRFEAFREAVHNELGLEPAPETLAMAERIGRGEALSVETDLARLEPVLRGLAQVIAVAGGILDVGALASVVERRPLDVAADLARLERGGWLDQHLTLAPAAERTVLASTPAVVRRILHQRIARVLIGLPAARPEEIARHLLGASCASEAAPYFVAAADAAIAGSRPEVAIPYLLRAMWAGWETPKVRLEAALLLEGCAGQLGDQELQDAALQEAEVLAWRMQTDIGLAEVRMRKSRTLLRRGSVGEGLESALEALEIATRLKDERLIARTRNAVGGAQYFAGDLDGAESSFRQNAEAADPVERYRARNNLGGIAGIKGRTREALAHLEEALTLGRAAGEHVGVAGTLNNLAATSERLGDYRRALKYFKESLALVRHSGSAPQEGHVLVNVSIVLSRLGELGPAWNTAIEVEEIAERYDEPRLLLLAHEQKAEVANICGDHSEALKWLGSAADLADEIADERKKAAVDAGLAVVRTLIEPQRMAAAADRLQALQGSNFADVAPWLWLELGLNSTSPLDAERFTDKAASFESTSEHLAAVVEIARLRTGLLAGATGDQRRRAMEAYSKVSERLETDVFQQALYGRVLVARWRAVTSDGGDSDALDSALGDITKQLADQAAGLPTSLATSLKGRPDAWRAGLRESALTPN